MIDEVDETIRFVVFGRPQGKGSKRVLPIRGGAPGRVVLVDSNKNAAPWASRVMSAARDAYDGRLIRGAVEVELAFYFARPKSHFGTGGNASRLRPRAPRAMITMPDLDKLARCTLDALVGVLIADDAQIASLRCFKDYGEPERVVVRVAEL